MRKVKAIIWLLILLSIMVYTIPMGSAGTEVLPGLGEPELGQEEPVEDVDKKKTNIDTTNPYKNIAGSPLGERYLAEGPLPLNVLIFAELVR